MLSASSGIIEYVLVHYRWMFVCLFLLPISFIFDLWLYLRNFIVFRLNSAPKEHGRKVKNVQSQIKDWNKGDRKARICTSRPGWQTISFRQPLYKKTSYQVDVNLVDILEIDPQRQVVRVEPLVTMGQLTATLNPLGWTIPIVPEIDDLTVGGLIMGTGIESSSHIHGLFQHICVSYELVLSDGSLVKCTPKDNSELFYGVPWSYGTLGILTAVEIEIVPCKKYVKLNYTPVRSLDGMIEMFKTTAGNPENEFLEILGYNLNEYVVMTGVQTDDIGESQFNPIGRWYKPWFFEHVRKVLDQNDTVVEYIPLRDYYHRHTRSLFWELQDIIPFGNHPVFRYLFGWLVPPKVSLLKLTQTEATKKLYENNHIIQDMLVPLGYLKSSIELFEQHVNVYPLWLCPFDLPNNPGMVHPSNAKQGPEMYVDIGVYGCPKANHFRPVETTRTIEEFVRNHKGFQMLYADTYMTKEEFRKMFDHQLYDKLRIELNCTEAFPDVYDKISKDART